MTSSPPENSRDDVQRPSESAVPQDPAGDDAAALTVSWPRAVRSFAMRSRLDRLALSDSAYSRLARQISGPQTADAAGNSDDTEDLQPDWHLEATLDEPVTEPLQQPAPEAGMVECADDVRHQDIECESTVDYVLKQRDGEVSANAAADSRERSAESRGGLPVRSAGSGGDSPLSLPAESAGTAAGVSGAESESDAADSAEVTRTADEPDTQTVSEVASGDTLAEARSGSSRPTVPDLSGQDDDVASLGESIADHFDDVEILNVLGKGAMGVAFRARIRSEDRIVALKTLFRRSQSSVDRFKSEFRSLADVAHPSIAALHDLISDGDIWYFTMELIDGVDFGLYLDLAPNVAPGQSLPEDLIRAARGGKRNPAALRVPTASSPEKIACLRSVFRQLVEGVAALHLAGVLHRDIKPSNVMVTRDGRVKLVDFGLATGIVAEADDADSGSRTVEGTIPYVSPEQAGGGPASEASDWYAVGVMLYESLCNVWPIRGRRNAILRDKQLKDPVPPSQLVDGVPGDLEDLCLRMLSRRPEDRPDARTLLELCGLDNGSRESALIVPAQRRNLPFVGRETQLEQLHDAMRSTRQGHSACVLVVGRSGVGKSHLVRHFLQDVRDSGGLVISGRCYERESVPYKAWDALIDSLAAWLNAEPVAQVLRYMPRRVAALLRLFPALKSVSSFNDARRADTVPSDRHELRHRAFEALRELITRIGDQTPLVLAVDDLHWGDEDSAALAVELLKAPDSPSVLLLGTHRQEELESSSFLAEFTASSRQLAEPLHYQNVIVEEFTVAESMELALRLLGDDSTQARQSAQQIAIDAQGNPFFVQELVRAERETASEPGRSVIGPVDGATGRVITKSLPPTVEDADSLSVRTRNRLDDVLWQRICRLPDDLRKLLMVIAIKGTPIPKRIVFKIADVVADGPLLLHQLRAQTLIRSARGADNVACYHDRIRETVRDHLPDEERRGIHRRIAEGILASSELNLDFLWLQVENPVPVGPEGGSSTQSAAGPLGLISDSDVDALFDLAFHFDAAGDSRQALPFACVAARRAHAQYSLEVAASQYQIAQRGAADAPRTVQFWIAEGLGRVQMLRGDYSAAESALLTARRLSDTDLVRARIDCDRGELAFKRGDVHGAATIIESALRSIGQFVPSSRLSLLASVTWEIAVQTLHSVFPGWLTGRLSAPASIRGKVPDAVEKEFLAIRLYSRLAYPYWFGRGPIPSVWTHLRELNRVERYAPTLELAQALSEHAPAMSMIPWGSRGVAYARRSQEIRRDFGHLLGQGQSLAFEGLVRYSAGQVAESVDCFRQAIQIFEQTGDWWESNSARYQLSLSLYRMGDLAGAIEEARRVHRSGLELKDDQASGISLHIWAMASHGQVPKNIVAREVARSRHDFQVTAQVLLAEGIRQLFADDPAGAVATFDQAQSVVWKHRLHSAWIAPIRPWLATALRHQIEGLAADVGPEQRRECRRLMRRLIGAVRGACWMSLLFRTDRPHALREAAELARLRGLTARALKLYDRSFNVAERSGSIYEAALTDVRRQRLRVELEHPGATDDLAIAHDRLAELRSRIPAV